MDLVGRGDVRPGSARPGQDWRSGVRFGTGGRGGVRRGKARIFQAVIPDKVRQGEARQGKVRQGMDYSSSHTGQGGSRFG